jgi:hypothetical protein
MAAGAGAEEGEELRLLSAAEAGGVGAGGAPAAEKSWRLNFDGFRPPEAHQERPPRGLHHHCLGVLGTSISNSHPPGARGGLRFASLRDSPVGVVLHRCGFRCLVIWRPEVFDVARLLYATRDDDYRFLPFLLSFSSKRR